MQIHSVRHKGLKRLIEDDDDRGIRRDLVGRVRNVLTVLIAAADMDGVQGVPPASLQFYTVGSGVLG
jgi:proteic killer suppression protein